MSTPPVVQLPPPRDPFDLGSRVRTGPGGGNPRRRRMAVLVGGVALFWLSALVLPAARPNQPWAHYVGAALLAIVFAGGVLAAATWLRERYRGSRRAHLVATPLAALAAGALVAGGVAAGVAGPSPLLGDAFAYAAELGLFATVVSALPLPGNDGSAVAFAAVAKRRGDAAAHATVSRLTLLSGFLLVAGGVALLLTGYVGVGIGAVFIGWLGVSAGRQARAQTQVAAALAGLSVSDVAVAAAPLPGWRSLEEALLHQPWPAHVQALPVSDWAGEPSGVLTARVAQAAMAGGRGETRVDQLALPLVLVPVIADDRPAGDVLALLATSVAGVALVTRGRDVAGTVTAADLVAAAGRPRLRPAPARDGASL